jgi:SPW repeat
MFKKGPIPAFVHGLFEYVAGVLLIAAPFLFSFDSDTATGIAVAAGVVVLVVTASTAMSTGLIKSIPVPAHVILDYVLALFLIASPFVFGFDDDGTATAFFLVLGIVHLLLTIATRFIRDDQPPRTSSAQRSTGTRPTSSSPEP